MTKKEIRKLESDLESKGLSDSTRRSIRNSSICIIDDKVADLDSFKDGLNREGFNNISTMEKITSINEVLASGYDLILLDLNDTAKDISKLDGVGVLQMVKDRKPKQLVFVITGKNISPEENYIISQADLVRKKPVLPADLSSDVENLLRIYRDKFWAGLEVLKELKIIDAELSAELSWFQRLKLSYTRNRLIKNIENHDGDILLKLRKIRDIIRYCSSGTSKLELLLEKILGE